MGDSSARLAPQAYENAFINTPSPRTSHSALQARLSAASKLNDSLADVFKERAAIEQQYVAALQKLASKRGAGGGVAGGRGELGGFGGVWERVWGEVNETASVHAQLEKKMREEVEGPLRRMNSKGDWAKLSMFDGNLDKTVKHLESCQTRLQKAQKKVDSSRKEKTMTELSESQAALSDAQQGWLIESPQVFSLYQSIDEGRLTELKELLAKWETSRSDSARREMEGSESAMMAILGWDTMEDLQEFLLKKGQSGGQSSRIQQPAANGNRNVSGVSNISAMSRAPTVRRQSSVTSGGGGGNDFNPSGSSSNLGGSSLNPLKSVFGRNRNRAGSTASKSGNNGPSRPGNNTNESYGGAAGGGGFDALGDGDDEPEQPSRRRETSEGSGAVETLEPVRENGRNTNGASAIGPTVDADGFSVPPPDHDKKPWEMEANNASLMDDDTDMHSSQPSEVPQLRLAMAPAPIQESEEERQAALARVQSTLLAQPPSAAGPTRRGTIARGRRDVRNTMFGGVPDDMPLGQAMAMGAFGNKPTSTSRSGSIKEGEQASSPSPMFGASAASAIVSPPLPTFPSSGNTNTLAASPVSYSNPERSNTMMSNTSSLSGQPNISHNPFDSNPSLATSSSSAPGTLRAAITETCNVVAHSGNIVKAMVAGEISCVVPTSSSSTSSTDKIHLRLENFEQLLKIAPNPQFVTPAGGSHPPGEYLLDPVALSSASGAAGGRVVLFKYQLHIGEGKASSLVPVMAVPQWKCEDDSTKLLINYTLSHPTAEVSEVAFSVPISSPAITKPQSKPFPGTYDPAAKRITYQAEPLGNGKTSEKVVARMSVEERTVPAPIGVKWVLKGGLCSGLGVSVVGGGGGDMGEFGGSGSGQEGWKLEEVVRSVISGKFTVE